MTTYIAFLRGINVGGKKIIRMDHLSSLFTGMGFSQVSTFIQSGNVIFSAKETFSEKLGRQIETGLEKALGFTVEVMVRSMKAMADLVEQDPFREVDPARDIKLYVCFLRNAPASIPALPLVVEKEALEVIAITTTEAIVISKPLKGHYGFPNNYVEKKLEVVSTARNWNTIVKIVRASANS
jgi:uncharacterized protein (DUF1697 family)